MAKVVEVLDAVMGSGKNTTASHCVKIVYPLIY